MFNVSSNATAHAVANSSRLGNSKKDSVSAADLVHFFAFNWSWLLQRQFFNTTVAEKMLSYLNVIFY